MQAVKVMVVVMGLAIIGIITFIILTLVQRTSSGTGDATSFGEVALPLAEGCELDALWAVRERSIQAIEGRLIIFASGSAIKHCRQVMLLNSETGAILTNMTFTKGCTVDGRGVTERHLVLHFDGLESNGCRRSIVMIDLESGVELGSFNIPAEP